VKFRLIKPTIVIALVMLVGAAASASASAERSGRIQVAKDCTQYTGASGSSCTITSSSVSEIGIGSRVTYDQAAGIPTGLLDSNVVLDAGNGNRALGRCTVDSTFHGLCTFSDGTGDLAGFSARVNVACANPATCEWNGTYRFRSLR
jgi:hypothetical protein